MADFSKQVEMVLYNPRKKKRLWKFDWSVPHRNGYEVYELLLSGDDEVQGMIALKHIRDQ